MNKSIINGIDVSECNIRFNHFEKNICELGNRKLGELHYLCSENPNCYFKQLKRLQEENEGLKSLNDFNVQKIEVLQEENEELKARLKTLDDEVLTIEITPDEFERYKKYEQALEEIRKEANKLLYELNPIYGYNNSNHFELLAKYVLAKTKEVLDDRN